MSRCSGDPADPLLVIWKYPGLVKTQYNNKVQMLERLWSEDHFKILVGLFHYGELELGKLNNQAVIAPFPPEKLSISKQGPVARGC